MGRFADFFREQSIPLAGQQRTKMLHLDKHFEDMEAERDTLKTENFHLQAQVKPLERRIEQLKQQIEGMQRKADAANAQSLDEKAEALLQAIAQGFQVAEKGGDSIIKGTKAQAAYYLGVLRERRLVRYVSANYTLDGRYVATQEGLEYLHKAGKL